MVGSDTGVSFDRWSRALVGAALGVGIGDGFLRVAGVGPSLQDRPIWAAPSLWTALLLLGSGVALVLQSARAPSGRSRIGRALGVSTGVGATVLLAASVSAGPFEHQNGLPGVPESVALLALSVAVASRNLDRPWVRVAWPVGVATALAVPFAAVVMVLFEAADMLHGAPALGITVTSAGMTALVAGATVLSRPDRQPLAWLLAHRDRSLLALLVVTFALVPVWVAIWRLILLASGLTGESVWILSTTMASLILGLPSLVAFRRAQRLAADQLTRSAAHAEAERQRAEAVEQYRILADNTVDVVVHLRDGRPVWVSPSIEAAFGLPAQQWLGKDFLPRIPPDDHKAVFDALARNARGDAAVARFRVVNAAGDHVWVEGHGKPYIGGGGVPDGVIVAVRNIDAQVEVEQELQRARDSALALAEAKSDYVSTVSHEIRSPLHAISGFSELLENQLSAEGLSEAAEWSRRVQAEAGRLTRLIEDLLDLSRLDAGRTLIAAKAFRLRRVVDEVIALSKLDAEAKGLRLDYSVDPTISDWRIGDADRLHQVLSNLVSNARKFTREGYIDVDVSQVATGAAEGLVRFAVTDTGPGIPGEDIDRIMQPFAQVWRSDAEQGSGLGLAISDKLVKAMGGTGLEVASLEGHGSTFHFTVPLPESAPADPSSGPDLTPTESAGTKTILVVDDNVTNQLLIEVQLHKLGYRCEIASNGSEALERLDTQRFDAVLMDCNMPVMDGYEATRRIRAGERGTGDHLPVLALTASASGSNRDACERAGMDSFLSKPLLLSRLAEELGRFIGAGDTPDGTTPSGNDCHRVPPILDHARVDRLLEELGAGAIGKVLSAFTTEMPGRLAELRRTAAQGDPDAVRRSAHALRSPSAMLGATALAEHLRAVEESSDPASGALDGRLADLVADSLDQLHAKLGLTTKEG
jgi:PAS domain S-box-containing protein